MLFVPRSFPHFRSHRADPPQIAATTSASARISSCPAFKISSRSFSDHLFRHMIHIEIHGTRALCRRIHRSVDIADRSDDIFIHIGHPPPKLRRYSSYFSYTSIVFLQIRITVGDQIPSPILLKLHMHPYAPPLTRIFCHR